MRSEWTSEASRILNISAQSTRQWEGLGILHATKTSNGVRIFSRRQVEALAKKRLKLRHQAI